MVVIRSGSLQGQLCGIYGDVVQANISQASLTAVVERAGDWGRCTI
jgi:hypothetical protein